MNLKYLLRALDETLRLNLRELPDPFSSKYTLNCPLGVIIKAKLDCKMIGNFLPLLGNHCCVIAIHCENWFQHIHFIFWVNSISNLHQGGLKSRKFSELGKFVYNLIILVHQEDLWFDPNRDRKNSWIIGSFEEIRHPTFLNYAPYFLRL